MSAVNHNHVECVSPNEWEDEAFVDQSNAAAEDAERPTKVKHLRHAAAALRSSFTALRPGSASSPKASAGGRRASTSGFVGSLLQGLANAVGLHRESSPARQSSAQDLSTGRSKAASGHSHTLARLSSAAMMRAEIQNFSQFGDLRNDSFTSRSCAKLRRRSSLLLPRLSDVSMSMVGGAPGPSILTATSGDLDRRSAPGPQHTALARLTCPGELPSPVAAPNGGPACSYAAAAAATAAALATPPLREQQPKGMEAASVAAAAAAAAASPFQASAMATAAGEMAGFGGGGGGGGGGLRARWSSSGAPPLQGSLALEIPSLPVAVSPHPPLHPPPQTRPSGSSLSPIGSRTASCDRLPPMTPLGAAGGGGLMSVRDRPPTPRGSSNVSPSSTFAKVLDSFHLPDILVGGSGRSVTERRSSVAGGGSGASFTRPSDIGVPRSRRNSVCSGPSMTGPGGAAITASLAKRAAAAAAAAGGSGAGSSGAAAASAPVGSSTLPSPVAPSSASWTGQSRPSGSVVKKTASQNAGILQEFHNSLELDEDGALAAVDAEFDRRFGQPLLEVPGAVDSLSPTIPQRLSPQHPQPHHLQPLSQPNQLSQPPSTPLTPSPPQLQPQPEMTPRAPVSERTALHSAPRRSYVIVDGAAAAAVAGGPPVCRAPRRVSCSATMTFDGPDDSGADHVMLSSTDAAPTYERISNKMRLASIRLSYAEGIVCGGGGGGGGGGDGGVRTPRVSLDLPPAVQPPARGSLATWTPQPPAGSAPPSCGRVVPVHLAAAVAVAGDAAS